MSIGFRLPALITAAAASLVLCSSAPAAPVTIGALPPSVPVPGCANGPFDLVPLTVAAGSDYVVPPGYTEITSWSTYASEGVGQKLALKVFRPLGSLKYEVVAEDAQELAPEQINTFPVEILVAGGDVVGLNSGNALAVHNGCLFLTSNPADTYGAKQPGVGVGETETFGIEKGDRVNVRVTISAPPVLNLVSPQSGPVSGGTSVIIAGQEFTGAKAVRFGKAPAAGFTVNSDNAITAVSPPSASAGTVDVSVTSAAGTTAVVSADRFTYVPVTPPTSTQPRNCVVPRLKGKSLKASKKRLRKSDCKIGKVRKLEGATAKTGKVVKQSPKPGKVLAPGSQVGVKLG